VLLHVYAKERAITAINKDKYLDLVGFVSSIVIHVGFSGN
jgi:hypothetical protein